SRVAEVLMAQSCATGPGAAPLPGYSSRYRNSRARPAGPKTRTSPPNSGGLVGWFGRRCLLEGFGEDLQGAGLDLGAGRLRLGDDELARLERVGPLFAALGCRLLDRAQLNHPGDGDDPRALLAQLVGHYRLEGGEELLDVRPRELALLGDRVVHLTLRHRLCLHATIGLRHVPSPV